MRCTENDTVVVPSTASLVGLALADMDGLPPDVVNRAVLAITDWIGVAIGGSRHPSAAIARDAFSDQAEADGRVTVLGTRAKMGELPASLVNGIQGHVLDFDDTHVPSVAHVSAPVLPAVFAVGEMLGVSGRQMIEAYVVGVEVVGRIGTLVGEQLASLGFHVTGVIGHLGAAAGVGRLLGLDETRMTNALGLAATQAAGLVESFGTMAKPFHAGKAAMGGLLAARLAEGGFTGPVEAVDGQGGLLGTLLQRKVRTASASEQPAQFVLLDVSFKPYASCFGTHAVIDAAVSMRQEWAPDPETISAVECVVNPLAAKVAAHPHPSSGLDAKFSIQYCVALGLFGEMATPTDFVDRAVQRSELRRLSSKVSVKADEAMPMGQASVRVTLEDGSVLRKDVVASSGTPQRPMSDERFHGKFENLVTPTLGKEGARRLWDVCGQLAEVTNLGSLTALTRPAQLDR